MAADVSKQLERAKRHLERNKIEEAVEDYQSALNEAPGHIESLLALGDLYTRLGQSDRATVYYGMLFDRFVEAREDNKALATYTRALKGVQQPPERMVRYALLLHKQGRHQEAVEQYALASELLLARGNEQMALECLERVAHLDPENAVRQFAAGELAERLGKPVIAARAFLRAGQLAESSGDASAAQELLARAYRLQPNERSPALLYAQLLLRRNDPAGAAGLLEPLSANEQDAAFLSTFGEALLRCGALDRARATFERLAPDYPAGAGKLFEVADAYLATHQDEQAVVLLRGLQERLVAARRENDFVARLDSLVESHSNSVALAEFWAAAYAKLNRETKYFEALGRLFDLYLAAGNVQGACETIEKLVDIDAYDSLNEQRMKQLEGRADPAFLTRIAGRLARVATHTTEVPAPAPAKPEPQPAASDFGHAPQSLEDLIVQAEIFVQYSLHGKAVERLQKIAEFFPGEEQRNERLRNLCQLANWWPKGSSAQTVRADSAPTAVRPAEAAAAPSDPADTMRDLARISEISQSLFRLPTARAILSTAINEMGSYLRATRCIGVIGPPGKPPQMAAEFCASGVEPANGGLLVRILAQFEHATPGPLGGLLLDATTAPLLRELGLEAAFGVVLTDRETRTQAGMVVMGYATLHAWRANEAYFLQAVSDQLLLSVSHTRLRSLARSVGVADEKTGLLARTSYVECLLSETQRAKSQGTALALALVQIDRGPELMRQQGEASLERYLEQLSRVLQSDIRQTDLGVKYTSWAIAFILPDTALAGAEILAEKLRKAGAQVRPPWNGQGLTLSISVAEAVTRVDFDGEDIVTDLINRAEAGLEEAKNRGGDALVALKALNGNDPARE
jgi:diguanylate cyclase (GGDEF)-like protein